jgi:hypothetical protein
MNEQDGPTVQRDEDLVTLFVVEASEVPPRIVIELPGQTPWRITCVDTDARDALQELRHAFGASGSWVPRAGHALTLSRDEASKLFKVPIAFGKADPAPLGLGAPSPEGGRLCTPEEALRNLDALRGAPVLTAPQASAPVAPEHDEGGVRSAVANGPARGDYPLVFTVDYDGGEDVVYEVPRGPVAEEFLKGVPHTWALGLRFEITDAALSELRAQPGVRYTRLPPPPAPVPMQLPQQQARRHGKNTAVEHAWATALVGPTQPRDTAMTEMTPSEMLDQIEKRIVSVRDDLKREVREQVRTVRNETADIIAEEKAELKDSYGDVITWAKDNPKDAFVGFVLANALTWGPWGLVQVFAWLAVP